MTYSQEKKSQLKIKPELAQMYYLADQAHKAAIVFINLKENII